MHSAWSSHRVGEMDRLPPRIDTAPPKGTSVNRKNALMHSLRQTFFFFLLCMSATLRDTSCMKPTPQSSFTGSLFGLFWVQPQLELYITHFFSSFFFFLQSETFQGCNCKRRCCSSDIKWLIRKTNYGSLLWRAMWFLCVNQIINSRPKWLQWTKRVDLVQ